MQTLENINFNTWCDNNNIFIENILSKNIFIIDEKKYYVKTYSEIVIDEDCCLNIPEEELLFIQDNEITFIVFEFGKRFYYTKLDEWKDEFNDIKYKANFDDFKYIGEPIDDISEIFDFIHLGAHTEYELLNGSHNSSLWCKKAKFLKQKSLAICDKNTLAGILSHQLSCQKEEIKAILGYTATIAYNYSPDIKIPTTYECKLYVMDEQGWQNLLQINRFINSNYDGFIPEQEFVKYSEGLIFVFSKESLVNKSTVKDAKKHIKYIKSNFDFVFYQIDTVEFYDDKADINHLNNIRTYLNEYRSLVEPILINDSYYIDKEMFQLKEYLNKTDRKVYEYSEDQHFKTLTDSYNSLQPMFKDEDYFLQLFSDMCENTMVVNEICNHSIETGNHKLPKYEFLDGMTNSELFYSIIEEGIDRKLQGKDNLDVYLERIEREYNVIINSGFVDYFLILWDIVKWAKENGMYVGPGRGSVGGCLLAYLMDIITVDPVENDLLFERFLNEARVSGERAKAADSMPDIDLDFETEHRETIKEYIRERFGQLHTCSIGSYTRLKIKGGLKDFSRAKNISYDKANYISGLIDDQLEYTWKDLFKFAQKEKDLKEFIQNNPDIIHLIKFSLNQARSASIHASAVIIVPNKDKQGNDVNIFNWLPIRQMHDRLVSEWEGKYTDRAGFLKEDILGLNQLDKFNMMSRLIKRNHDKDIVLEEIELNDRSTYKLFHKGYTEDVFQFGSSGLKSYSLKAKPDTIEDLTAMSALYRPGPMSSNAHMDFALIKHGKKKPEYDYKLRTVTENTYGLYVYQEQIMQAVVVLGGFTLVESDMLRTQIKKFDKVGMGKSEEKFITGAINNGCDPEEAQLIWKKLLAFSGYGFNKSHSFAYSVMTYLSQWMKSNYPLEFWTTSLHFAKDEDVPKRVAELKRLKQGIDVKPPSINNSGVKFDCNIETMNVYWSLTKIKNVGAVATNLIIDERDKNGMFGSYDDFISRVPKAKVNKRTVTNLILAGAFDEVEGLHYNTDRLALLTYHYSQNGEDVPEEFQNEDMIYKSYFWTLKQRDLTGFGTIDYKTYLRNLKHREARKMAEMYVDGESFFNLKDYAKACICGKVLQKYERKSKNGDFLVMKIGCNDDTIIVNVWNDIYVENSEFLVDCVGKVIGLTGKAKYDTWRNENVLNTIDETIFIDL